MRRLGLWPVADLLSRERAEATLILTSVYKSDATDQAPGSSERRVISWSDGVALQEGEDCSPLIGQRRFGSKRMFWAHGPG